MNVQDARIVRGMPGRRGRRATLLVAWGTLAVAVAHPPHGTGVPLCWMKATTGLPCPGCGLMRSVSCLARGRFAESWRYHPFGTLVLGVCVCIVAGPLLPQGRRDTMNGAPRAESKRRAAYALLVGAFLLHGTARAVFILLSADL